MIDATFTYTNLREIYESDINIYAAYRASCCFLTLEAIELVRRNGSLFSLSHIAFLSCEIYRDHLIELLWKLPGTSWSYYMKKVKLPQHVRE